MKNHLDKALSPYLLQHKDNPVHWYSWCNLAFERAQKENKPIFLSIGYAACHWCHVMAHESFEDNKTAQILNQYFICIKVDREEHPQIDKIYMDFVTKVYGQGGWPLSVFITPEGKPFAGGTYFPNKPGFGLPSFLNVLENIINLWQNQRDEIEESSNQIVAKINQKLSFQPSEDTLNFSKLELYKSNFKMNIDMQNGGLLGAPKFPQIPLWQWLFALAKYSHDTELLDSCYLTANKLCLGGIYDHVGGGWMRYSTDDKWLVPHFEKMLYDNALNIAWLSELYVYRPNKIYKYHIEQTIQWLMRDMYLPDGLFASSLDADINGEEGEYYVWSENEINKLLSIKLEDFKKCYGIKKDGNWQGKNILHRNHKDVDQYPTTNFKEELQTLLANRNDRGSLARDNKIVVEWNAYLISALAKAGQIFQKKEWIELAEKTYKNLSALLCNNGKWYRCYHNHQHSDLALLDDYAAIIDALLNLYLVTGTTNKLDKAIEMVDYVEVAFRDKENHLYNQISFEDNNFITNPQTIYDNATPSNNGLMANNLARLYLLTGESKYREKINNMLNTLAPSMQQSQSFFLSSFCNTIAFIDVGIVIKLDIQSLSKPMANILFSKKPPLAMILNEKRKDIIICDNNKCISIANINNLETTLKKHFSLNS